MGLDAAVYCNCFERGRPRNCPQSEWSLYVDETGARCARTDDLKLLLAFDQWNEKACEHENGVWLHHRLGNISEIELIRSGLKEIAERYPVLLSKVVYNGTHCGDFLSSDEAALLSREIPWLSTVHFPDASDEEYILRFEANLKELVEVAIRLGRPVFFKCWDSFRKETD